MTKVQINLTVAKGAAHVAAPDGARRVSSSVQESLVQVRAAREAARQRAARESRKARLVMAAVVGGAVAVGYAVLVWPGHTPAKGQALAAAAPVVVASSAAPAMKTPARTATAVVASAPAPVAPAPAAPAPAATAPAAVPEAPPADAAACQDAFRARRWRAMAEPCAAAYAATPTATLALRTAQSHHARGQLADARSWAERALAIDPRRAEALILVARGARHAGDAGAALRAYRRYLSLAPRGWHADEARGATSQDPVY